MAARIKLCIKNESKLPSLPLRKSKKRKKELKGVVTYTRKLETLFEEIVTKPFDNHVALAWSHWLVVDTNDQGHCCLFNSNTSWSL
ncbi:hypothetical protein Hanom_Chr10g00964631 [Helianthus anomalus]